MGKNKISESEAIEIANEFYNRHCLNVGGKNQEFKASGAKKSFISPKGWDVCFQLITEEGYAIDGPVFVFVDENGDAQFI